MLTKLAILAITVASLLIAACDSPATNPVDTAPQPPQSAPANTLTVPSSPSPTSQAPTIVQDAMSSPTATPNPAETLVPAAAATPIPNLLPERTSTPVAKTNAPLSENPSNGDSPPQSPTQTPQQTQPEIPIKDRPTVLGSFPEAIAKEDHFESFTEYPDEDYQLLPSGYNVTAYRYLDQYTDFPPSVATVTEMSVIQSRFPNLRPVTCFFIQPLFLFSPCWRPYQPDSPYHYIPTALSKAMATWLDDNSEYDFSIPPKDKFNIEDRHRGADTFVFPEHAEHYFTSAYVRALTTQTPFNFIFSVPVTKSRQVEGTPNVHELTVYYYRALPWVPNQNRLLLKPERSQFAVRFLLRVIDSYGSDDEEIEFVPGSACIQFWESPAVPDDKLDKCHPLEVNVPSN